MHEDDNEKNTTEEASQHTVHQKECVLRVEFNAFISFMRYERWKIYGSRSLTVCVCVFAYLKYALQIIPTVFFLFFFFHK